MLVAKEYRKATERRQSLCLQLARPLGVLVFVSIVKTYKKKRTPHVSMETNLKRPTKTHRPITRDAAMVLRLAHRLGVAAQESPVGRASYRPEM